MVDCCPNAWLCNEVYHWVVVKAPETLELPPRWRAPLDELIAARVPVGWYPWHAWLNHYVGRPWRGSLSNFRAERLVYVVESGGEYGSHHWAAWNSDRAFLVAAATRVDEDLNIADATSRLCEPKDFVF